jgi:cell division septal protein FtsQ
VKDEQKSQKISKTLKRQKRRRIARRITAVILIAAIICVGGYYLSRVATDQRLNIKQVEVTGNASADTHLLDQVTDALIGQNILAVDVNSLSNQAKKILQSDQVSVYRKWPDTLVIKVGRIEALGAVMTGNKVLYIDQNARVVNRADYLTNVNLPIITGIKGTSALQSGGQLSSNSREKLIDALDILARIQDKGLLDRVSEIHWTKYNTYRIITKNNSVFEVNGIDNFKKNESYVETFLIENRSNVEVDLQIDGQAFLKNRS